MMSTLFTLKLMQATRLLLLKIQKLGHVSVGLAEIVPSVASAPRVRRATPTRLAWSVTPIRLAWSVTPIRLAWSVTRMRCAPSVARAQNARIEASARRAIATHLPRLWTRRRCWALW